MWLFIAVLCVIIMFLFCLALFKTSAFSDEKDELNARICELARQLRKSEQKIVELEQIRANLHEANTKLINKNRELQNYRDSVESVIDGKRTAEEKINKINELDSSNKHI